MFERASTALLRAVWRRAMLAGLLMGLVGVVSYSVDHANWVTGVAWWPGAWLALLGAAALAGTRWKGRWALLYSVALLMAGAAELVGRVLPGLAPTPGEWVINLHLRAVTLGQRLQAWGQSIAAGRPVGDTGLFVWLLALVSWGAVAWLAWSVVRRRQALAGCLPVALVLAVNTYLSGQPWQELLLFVVLALALLIDTTFISQNADWDRRGVDYPDDLGLDWSTAAIGLTLGIGFLSAAAPVVATPSGWHVLGDALASSQQQVVSTADQLFTGVRAPSRGLPPPVARTPDLTNIGSGVDQSTDTLMWVTVNEPAPTGYPGAPAPPQHYWRSGLYATYTGSGWQPAPLAAEPSNQPASPAPPGRYVLQQNFQIVAVHGQAEFAVSLPISATAGAALVGDPADADTALLAGAASSYAVDSLATKASESELRAAGSAYPAAIRADYLQVPASLPARVAGLAAQIAGGAADPYDQALQLQDYLRRTYRYTLDVPPPPAGEDAVDYFLYEAPGGYCSYYASAMAVMLRTLGVPARVATGYAMGTYDASHGAYRVTGADAHAWVEVYFPTYGWVEFEPTAARAVFDRPAGDSAATPTATVAALNKPASIGPVDRAVGVVLGVIGVLMAVALWVGWQLSARRPPESPRQRALRLYGRMRAALGQAGLSAPASVTADEYLQARAGELAAQPRLLAAVTEATELYRRAAYSPHPVAEGETRNAARAWAGARLAWLRLTLSRRLALSQMARRLPGRKKTSP